MPIDPLRVSGLFIADTIRLSAARDSPADFLALVAGAVPSMNAKHLAGIVAGDLTLEGDSVDGVRVVATQPE